MVFPVSSSAKPTPNGNSTRLPYRRSHISYSVNELIPSSIQLSSNSFVATRPYQ